MRLPQYTIQWDEICFGQAEDYRLRYLFIAHITFTRMGFSSVLRLSGWSFQQLIYGGVLPPPHCPDISGPAVSPIDKLRKDSALPPVTSEKPTLIIRVIKIVRFSKGIVT
jgi:hypothetical protein